MHVDLPYEPRHYQREFLTAMNSGIQRACLVWHRQSGKEMSCFNWTMYAALQRPGIYYYFFPTAKQGRRVIWYGMDLEGRRWIDYYLPRKLIARKQEVEMRIELVNGSIFQVLGIDDYKKDDIVGTGLMGAVFSEYSIQDPSGWDYMRPILTNSNGWAIFNFTPRGHNHAKELYDRAAESAATDGRWFCSRKTVDDTHIPGIYERIENERKDGMPEERLQQEYYCSFNAGLVGSYFADAIEHARTQGRIGVYPPVAGFPVHTAWDIGINDPTAIWFFQKIGDQPRIIRYYEKRDRGGIPAHARYLKSLDYHYGCHLGPHDVAVTEQSGLTRWDIANEVGIDFDIQDKPNKDDVIVATQALISRMLFDVAGCQQGIRVLEAYEEEYDPRLRIFRGKPKHNWASHGADALQTLALGFDNVTNDLFETAAHAPRVREEWDIWSTSGYDSIRSSGRYPGYSPPRYSVSR